MLTFLLLTLWCHGPLSPFLPAAYEPILLFYGQLHPPLVVALAGAFASAAVEYLNYYLYRAMLGGASMDRVMSSRSGRAVTTLFARRPFLAVWICAWSPLPDWASRILAAHSRYSVRRYLAAVLAGRIPKFWFLAAVGMHWAPSGATIGTIVVVSVAVTLGGMFFRRSSGRPGLAAGPVALLVKGGASSVVSLGLHGATLLPGLQAGGGVLSRPRPRLRRSRPSWSLFHGIGGRRA